MARKKNESSPRKTERVTDQPSVTPAETTSPEQPAPVTPAGSLETSQPARSKKAKAKKVTAKKSRAKKTTSRQRKSKQSPLDEALNCLEQASRALLRKRRIALLDRAIALAPELVPAYWQRAEEEPTAEEAVPWFEQAVAAGVRVLGCDPASIVPIDLSLNAIAQAYLESRVRLASVLRSAHRHEESARHCREILEMNPSDQLKVRWLLFPQLLAAQQDQEALQLTNRYREPDSTFWRFARALLNFRHAGDCIGARRRLEAAVLRNRYLLLMLLGDIEHPEDQDPSASMEPGSFTEAFVYLTSFRSDWMNTTGARAWLRKWWNSRAQPLPRIEEVTPARLAELKAVPQDLDRIWELDWQWLPTWIHQGSRIMRTGSVLIVDAASGAIVYQEVLTAEPSPEQVFDMVARGIQQPMWGTPGRPREIQIRPGTPWNDIDSLLQAVEIDYVQRPDLSNVDMAFDSLKQFVLQKEKIRGVLNQPGMTVPWFRELCEAAAALYRDRPWSAANELRLIQVDWSEPDTPPQYVSASADFMQFRGLTLHEQLPLPDFLEFDTCDEDDDAAAAWPGVQYSSVACMLGESHDLSGWDLWNIERLGIELAGPEAYPSFLAMSNVTEGQTPSVDQLRRLLACLRTVPQFLREASRLSTAEPRQYQVRCFDTDVTLRLSWQDNASEFGV